MSMCWACMPACTVVGVMDRGIGKVIAIDIEMWIAMQNVLLQASLWIFLWRVPSRTSTQYKKQQTTKPNQPCYLSGKYIFQILPLVVSQLANTGLVGGPILVLHPQP